MEMLDALTRPVRASGNFEAHALGIPGPLLIVPRVFRDGRGFFLETWSERDFVPLGVGGRFVQDNHSFSAAAGTVRGMHYQLPPRAQAKLVRVLRGAVLDVVVDMRRGSPTYGRHAAAELSAADARQVYVPAGFAHGFCTLEPMTEVAYKAGDYYDPGWNGDWPGTTPTSPCPGPWRPAAPYCPTRTDGCRACATWPVVRSERRARRPSATAPLVDGSAMLLSRLKLYVGRAVSRWRRGRASEIPILRPVRCGGLEEFQRLLAATEAARTEQTACEASLLRPEDPFAIRGTCAVCRGPTEFQVGYGHCFVLPDGARVPNWREQLLCPGCGLNNRMRAAFQFLQERLDRAGALYLTEQVTPLFRASRRGSARPSAASSSATGLGRAR
jgi:dTDP-4-dehydrorhamnose 3,5-epimerase